MKTKTDLLKNLISGNTSPRNLFIVDGLGALLSAFLLGVVLVKLENTFGIPKATLYFLAFLPCLFALYDIYAYLQKNKNVGILLQLIAYMNIAYCFLSIGLAIYHFGQVTFLGWAYIIIEIMIVIFIAKIELKAAQSLLQETNPQTKL